MGVNMGEELKKDGVIKSPARSFFASLLGKSNDNKDNGGMADETEPVIAIDALPAVQPVILTMPTPQPTSPTPQPAPKPIEPTVQPTAQMTTPATQPATQPAVKPAEQPIAKPTEPTLASPTSSATAPAVPTQAPQPTTQPTAQITTPATQPAAQPAELPKPQPAGQPVAPSAAKPAEQTPNTQPSAPTPPVQPAEQPKSQPAEQPKPIEPPKPQPTEPPAQPVTPTPTPTPTPQPAAKPAEPPAAKPAEQSPPEADEQEDGADDYEEEIKVLKSGSSGAKPIIAPLINAAPNTEKKPVQRKKRERKTTVKKFTPPSGAISILRSAPSIPKSASGAPVAAEIPIDLSGTKLQRVKKSAVAMFIDIDNTNMTKDNLEELFYSITARQQIIFVRIYGYGPDKTEYDDIIAKYNILTVGKLLGKSTAENLVDFRVLLDAYECAVKNPKVVDTIFVWTAPCELSYLFEKIVELGVATATIDNPAFDCDNKWTSTKVKLFSPYDPTFVYYAPMQDQAYYGQQPVYEQTQAYMEQPITQQMYVQQPVYEQQPVYAQNYAQPPMPDQSYMQPPVYEQPAQMPAHEQYSQRYEQPQGQFVASLSAQQQEQFVAPLPAQQPQPKPQPQEQFAAPKPKPAQNYQQPAHKQPTPALASAPKSAYEQPQEQYTEPMYDQQPAYDRPSGQMPPQEETYGQQPAYNQNYEQAPPAQEMSEEEASQIVRKKKNEDDFEVETDEVPLNVSYGFGSEADMEEKPPETEQDNRMMVMDMMKEMGFDFNQNGGGENAAGPEVYGSEDDSSGGLDDI
jgi:hypothetical protein